MSFFSFQKSTSHSSVVFDIGSGSVGGAVFKKENSAQHAVAHIEYTKHVPLPLKERIHTKTLIDNTVNSIKEISQEIFSLKRRVDSVDVVLSSPWYASYTKSLVFEKKEAFTISQSFLDEIIEKELKEMTKGADKEMKLIEKRISNVKINGYSTSSPFGKKTNKIELSLYVSLAPISFLEKIELAIHQSLAVKTILFHSFPLSAFSVIRNIFQNDSDFVFIDVAGEVTDVLAVKNGSIVGTASFPLGKNHLVRKVADHFKVDSEIALSFVKIFSDGNAADDVKQKVGTLSAAIKEEWLAYFGQITADMYGAESFPGKVFITSDEDVRELVEDYTDNLFSKKVYMGSETLAQFATFDPHVEQDPFLTLESVYLSTLS